VFPKNTYLPLDKKYLCKPTAEQLQRNFDPTKTLDKEMSLTPSKTPEERLSPDLNRSPPKTTREGQTPMAPYWKNLAFTEAPTLTTSQALASYYAKASTTTPEPSSSRSKELLSSIS